MKQRPDYVPVTWTGGRLNRSFARSPRRVFWWLVLTPLLCLGAGILLFVAGALAFGILALAAAIVNAVQAAIYAPRARRASRQA